MKKTIVILGAIALATISCKNKEEVYEVDVPSKEESAEKISELGSPKDIKADKGPFQMQGLNYEYNGLEPHMDATTVATHYGKHHLGYCNKLNEAVAGTELENLTIEEVLAKLDVNNNALRNNAGGYYNHNLFWEILGANKGGNPTGDIADLINTQFGSYDKFKDEFKKAATGIFGSGWAWLVVKADKTLEITTTANQDNPLMSNATVKGTPIMGIDVWEHAYYLKHKNKRADFIDAFFDLLDWNKINEKYKNVK